MSREGREVSLNFATFKLKVSCTSFQHSISVHLILLSIPSTVFCVSFMHQNAKGKIKTKTASHLNPELSKMGIFMQIESQIKCSFFLAKFESVKWRKWAKVSKVKKLKIKEQSTLNNKAIKFSAIETDKICQFTEFCILMKNMIQSR